MIHRSNLNKMIYIKRILIRNINILLEKIRCKLILKINKPGNIFNDIVQHINQKKKICSVRIYNFIYNKLKNIYEELDNSTYDRKKINCIIVSMTRK
jgi:hypothetical protein